MTYGLLGAAILATLVAVAHSVLGERYILTRLFRREDLPPLFGSDVFTRRTLRFAWHVTSIAWLGLAGVLVLMAGEAPPRAAILQIVAATFFVTALIAGIGSRGRHLSWIAFGAIALLVWRAV